MASLILLPSAAREAMPSQKYQGRHRSTVVPQRRVKAMRIEMERRRSAPPPRQPDAGTIAWLEDLLQKARIGEVQGLEDVAKIALRAALLKVAETRNHRAADALPPPVN